jgi:hypothetical protein
LNTVKPSKSHMKIVGPGKSHMKIGGPGKSHMKIGGPGKSHMKIGGPGKSHMKIGGPGKSHPSGRQAMMATSTRRAFSDRLKSGDLKTLTGGGVAREVRLHEQYHLARKGDVARRLHVHARTHGVVHPHNTRHEFHHAGRLSPSYTHGCMHLRYWGPGHYPRHCWYPKWTHWVDWSWHFHCGSIFDPRPIYCRPVIYVAAPRWVYWEYPVWVSLPVVSSGTWVDVPPVAADNGNDLQLLAVRFVDPGHPEEKLGPRYRVWIRNNGDEALTRPFNVLLLVSVDGRPAENSPQAGVRVEGIEPGDIQSMDIRLPIEAFDMARDEQGDPIPFATLHVIVDADQEIAEVFETNNGGDLVREDILPVDPAAFELEPVAAGAGGQVSLAGEGFGPQPGQVLIHLGNIEMQAEILGWYDLGVRLVLPNLPLAGPTEADVIVIRADGAAANPLKVTITPPKEPGGLRLLPPELLQ